ncbi:WD40-repeat-containing domain protein [Chytridium lagenaria]|nr:WD40-repeat-containing domain protein [Chytridium lagenaria]
MSEADDDEFEVLQESVENGSVDIQGINWQSCPVPRDVYRSTRIMKNLTNYTNLHVPNDEILKDMIYPRTDGFFYRFHYTNLRYKCSYGHFQLRNLIWATSSHDVFLQPCNEINPFIKITSMAAANKSLFAGGLSGDYYFKRLEPDAAIHTGKITMDPNGITNHVELNESRNGVPVAIISSNDEMTRVFDLNQLTAISEFPMPWAVNCSTLSPDKRMICIVGDERDAHIVNANSGEVEIKLSGHIDYSFACAWSPCGLYVATGNQDVTTRIYDLRNHSKSIAVLPGTYGAIRSLRFSDDGRFLAAAEPADFVHVYDFKDPGYRSQIIDFFGDIAGISFSPRDGNSLFIGNAGNIFLDAA